MTWLPLYSLLLALACLLLPALYFDIRYYRIPNSLCLAGCLAGLLFGFAMGGPGQMLNALLGLLLAFAIGLPFWLLGWMGAGDVKLTCAVGAFVAWPLVLKVLAGIAFAGLVLALLALLWRRQLGAVFYRHGVNLRLSAMLRNPAYLEPSLEQAEQRLPYAIAIAAGSLLTVWMFG